LHTAIINGVIVQTLRSVEHTKIECMHVQALRIAANRTVS